MHDIIMSILVGIVEGLTEFLPVSSTAHLLIVQRLLGFDPPGQVYDIVIQFGAILAVVVVFWQKFWLVARNIRHPEAQHFTLAVIVAFLPAAVVGATLHGFIKHYLFSDAVAPWVIGTMLIVGGYLIILFEHIAPKPTYLDADRMPYKKAFQIGLFQCLAIIPGVSRSGATILGGEMVGVERKAGAAFTFYLAVPTMLGATVLDLWKNRDLLDFSAGLEIVVGFVTAFIVALFVVRGFIAFIGRYGLKPFGWYRIGAGLVVFALALVLKW